MDKFDIIIPIYRYIDTASHRSQNLGLEALAFILHRLRLLARYRRFAVYHYSVTEILVLLVIIHFLDRSTIRISAVISNLLH